MSFADILKTGLGILQSKAKKDDTAYYKGYNAGYRRAELEEVASGIERNDVLYNYAALNKQSQSDISRKSEFAIPSPRSSGWFIEEALGMTRK